MASQPVPVLSSVAISAAKALSPDELCGPASACSPTPGTPSTRCWHGSPASSHGEPCSASDLGDEEAEPTAGAASLPLPARPLGLLPMERAVAESGLCVRNTFLDFDAAPPSPSGERRARSEPAGCRRRAQRGGAQPDEDAAPSGDGLRGLGGHFELGFLPPPMPAAALASLGPTWGSMLHDSGRCRPCLFAHRGCRNGVACAYCHLCEPDNKKRQKLQKQKDGFSWRQLRKATRDKARRA